MRPAHEDEPWDEEAWNEEAWDEVEARDQDHHLSSTVALHTYIFTYIYI